jgi:hypothetical protein
MMPQRAMQKRVSPEVQNALDNAGIRQPIPPKLQNT